MAGSRGPVGKRSGQTRRRNKKDVDEAPSLAANPPDGVEVRKPNSKWHPIAKRWFESLSMSGQSQFYEESDWATAWFCAEAMSRELGLQIVGRTEAGELIKDHVPIKGASLAAIGAMMTKLLVTEGDRRRSAIELKQATTSVEGGGADVSNLDEFRQRLESGDSAG